MIVKGPIMELRSELFIVSRGARERPQKVMRFHTRVRGGGIACNQGLMGQGQHFREELVARRHLISASFLSAQEASKRENSYLPFEHAP
jgi:hypothetical protein